MKGFRVSRLVNTSCIRRVKVKSESCSFVSNSLRSHWLYSPWNSLGQNTGVGSLSILQGIFSTQGSNQDLLYCRWIFCQLSHKGSPRILEWVAYPFSRGSSWPRNWTRVFCIAGRFFTNWAIREALIGEWHTPNSMVTKSFCTWYPSRSGLCTSIHLHLYNILYSKLVIVLSEK